MDLAANQLWIVLFLNLCMSVCVCSVMSDSLRPHWRIITLQCCIGFWHTIMWISHKCICVCVYKCMCICVYTHFSLPPLLTTLGHHRVSGWAVLYSSFQLVINFTHSRVYISILLSQFFPQIVLDFCFWDSRYLRYVLPKVNHRTIRWWGEPEDPSSGPNLKLVYCHHGIHSIGHKLCGEAHRGWSG